MPKLNSIYFMPFELSEESYEVYVTSDFYFFVDDDGYYYISDNKSGTRAVCIGSSLQMVNDYLYEAWLIEN